MLAMPSMENTFRDVDDGGSGLGVGRGAGIVARIGLGDVANRQVTGDDPSLLVVVTGLVVGAGRFGDHLDPG